MEDVFYKIFIRIIGKFLDYDKGSVTLWISKYYTIERKNNNKNKINLFFSTCSV